jgi:hypothetical protein
MDGGECSLLLPDHGGESPWPNISGYPCIIMVTITSNPWKMPDINHSPDHGRQTVNVHIPSSLDVVLVFENYTRQHAAFPRESPLGHW